MIKKITKQNFGNLNSKNFSSAKIHIAKSNNTLPKNFHKAEFFDYNLKFRYKF